MSRRRLKIVDAGLHLEAGAIGASHARVFCRPPYFLRGDITTE